MSSLSFLYYHVLVRYVSIGIVSIGIKQRRDQVLFRFLLDCFCALDFLPALELLLLSSNSGANTLAISVEASNSGSSWFLSAKGGRGNALYQFNNFFIRIACDSIASMNKDEPENGL